MKIRKKLEKIKKTKIYTKPNKTKNTEEPDVITRISFYLAISDMSQDAKESWATLLPHMNRGQLQRLAHILEASFLDAATRGIDDEFNKKLKQITATYANTDDAVPTEAPVLKRVRLIGENNAGKRLTAEQQVKLLNILKEYFQHRVRNIRAKQYSAVAKVIERLDKERAEEAFDYLSSRHRGWRIFVAENI